MPADVPCSNPILPWIFFKHSVKPFLKPVMLWHCDANYGYKKLGQVMAAKQG